MTAGSSYIIQSNSNEKRKKNGKENKKKTAIKYDFPSRKKNWKNSIF